MNTWTMKRACFIGFAVAVAGCGQSQGTAVASSASTTLSASVAPSATPTGLVGHLAANHAGKYSVTVVNAEPGCELPVWISKLSPMAPPDIAMASNGDVAFVEHGPAKDCGVEDGTIATGTIIDRKGGVLSIVHETIGLKYSVVVMKAAGRRLTIRSLPPLSFPTITEELFSIVGLRLADDGTPFITLAVGADSTRETEWVYSWNGTVWRAHENALPIHYIGPENRSIGAVEAPSRFAVVGDRRDAIGWSYDDQERDPTYHMDETGVVNGQAVTSLGFGDVTSMSGRYSAGYAAPYGWCWQVGAPTAVLWNDAKRTNLGPGIAFGVDTNGDAVGDDRPPESNHANLEADTDCIDGAHPTLWRDGKARQLSALRGSALAIRNGTIVGTVGVQPFCCVTRESRFVALTGGRGFITRVNDAPNSIRYLDDLTTGDWSITSAFAIARSGRILAIGHPRGSDASSILILDPH